MHSRKIYLFSGLGADERVLLPLDLSGYEPVFIQWLRPQKHETMTNYALRLCDQIKEPDPVLIGLSFGGMLAVEVAQHISARQIVLLASAKMHSEIPWYFRLAGKMCLPQLIPVSWFRRTNPLVHYLFGAQSASEKILLREILAGTDPVFLKWALTQIPRWTNTTIPANLFHLHGTKDRLLPFRTIRNPGPVEGGGHFMTVNQNHEVSALLQRILEGGFSK